MAVELDAFRALRTARGWVELERHGALTTRTPWRGQFATFLGFPVAKQRRSAVVALVSLIERDYPEDAQQLLAAGNISLVDLALDAQQLKRTFAAIDRLAVEKPNPEHFIEATEILSELVGRAVNNTLADDWVLRAAARLEALGLAVTGEAYLTIAVEAAVEDQIAGRLLSREAVTSALVESAVLGALADTRDKKHVLASRIAVLLRSAHRPSPPAEESGS